MSGRARGTLSFGIAISVLVAGPAAAQTVISPDSGANFDAGTIVSPSGIETTITGGTRAGDNLFHSFAQFDLAQGDIAQWVRGAPDAASIANVINRVTGGEPSDIAGTLRLVDMPSAAFWFINPAGVFFGAGAAVDVPGAAYFSAGEELRFADGLSFSTVTPGGSTFSSAAPASFGFLGGQGDIVVSAVDASFSRPGSILAFAAADIAISGGFEAAMLDLTAIGDARLDLALSDPLVHAGTGAVSIGPDSTLVSGRFRIAADRIDLSGAYLEMPATGGTPGGIVMEAGLLTLDASVMDSYTIDAANGGSVALRADTIAFSNGSFVVTQADPGSTGRAGDLLLEAGTLDLDGSVLVSQTFGSGDAGSLSVEADSIALSNLSFVFNRAGSGLTGSAGEIRIDAGSLLLDNSELSSSTFGMGDAGKVRILADTVALSNRSFLVSETRSGAAGNAGGIAIEAKSLALDNSQLFAATFGPGDAGPVGISAEEVVLVNQAIVGSSVLPGAAGVAGGLVIETGSLLLDGSSLTSATFGSGNAGSLTVLADSMALANGAIISAQANGGSTGAAGSILVDTGSLTLDLSGLSSSTFGGGDAGSVTVLADTAILSSGSFVASDSAAAASGNGGQVAVEVSSLVVDNSQLRSSTFGEGDGGSVAVTANMVTLVNGAELGSRSLVGATGKAGDTRVEAGSIVMDGSRISSSTFGSGNAGQVSVSADSITMSFAAKIDSRSEPGATGDSGNVTIHARELDMTEFASIGSTTHGAGSGGVLEVFADVIRLENRASLQTLALADGDGGSIRIRSLSSDPDQKTDITLDVFSVIGSFTQEGLGNAGIIDIEAGNISIINGSSINTEARPLSSGDAGLILITADEISLAQSGRITSAASGLGDAGGVTLLVDRLLQDRAQISSSTLAGGNAGSVTIAGRDGGRSGGNIVELGNQSEISSLTAGAGDAGLVDIVAADVLLSGESAITSQTQFGTSGDAGDVHIDSGTLSLHDRSLVSSATAGSGDAGRVDLTIGELSIADGSITTSTVGSGNAGALTISSETIVLGPAGFIVSAAGPGSTGNAGDVIIAARSVRSEGGSIEARSVGLGDAGSIEIAADRIELRRGGAITTNSDLGPAGAIVLRLPRSGQLILAGEDPGVVTTTSGQNSGGRITISDPYLILSDGGSILALGEVSGANARISSDYFLRSADRINLLSVNGNLVLDSQFSDLSAGTEAPDIDFFDASSVLRSQCASTRASGQTSRFTSRITGPYAPLAEVPADKPGAGAEDGRTLARSTFLPCG